MTAFCTPLPDFNSLAQLSPASPAQPPGTQPSLEPSLLYKLSPPDPFTDPQIQETKSELIHTPGGGEGGGMSIHRLYFSYLPTRERYERREENSKLDKDN